MKLLVFFDRECHLCRQSVHLLIEIDKEEKFIFAPLAGKTASSKLIGNLAYLRNQNALVLIETPHDRIWVAGRAVFRIFWLLGGKWRVIGWLYTIPFVDFFYRQVAKHRHRFSGKDDFETRMKEKKSRFLP